MDSEGSLALPHPCPKALMGKHGWLSPTALHSLRQAVPALQWKRLSDFLSAFKRMQKSTRKTDPPIDKVLTAELFIGSACFKQVVVLVKGKEPI